MWNQAKEPWVLCKCRALSQCFCDTAWLFLQVTPFFCSATVLRTKSSHVMKSSGVVPRSLRLMHNLWARVSNVSAFLSTCTMTLLFGVALSSLLFSANPTGKLAIRNTFERELRMGLVHFNVSAGTYYLNGPWLVLA